MKKKALILDLDNTIYSVYTIGEELFRPLFDMIAADETQKHQFAEVKKEMQTTPFQKVAEQFGFSESLKQKATSLLREIEFDGEMKPFDDYEIVRALPLEKFLVTTGFTKMQSSKVRNLKLEQDFKEIHIVDPATSKQTKKDVFTDIMKKYQYKKEELLVIGDDPKSEIKAALELGIDVVLVDKLGRYEDESKIPRIVEYSELEKFL